MLNHTINGRRQGRSLHLLLGCLLFVVALRCEAQNLVPNGSFEETDSCWQINTWYYPETGPLGWFSTLGSGDYYLSCLPYGAFNGVPLSAVAFQYPQDGSAYVGVITYHHLQGREYFAVELTEPMQVGATYYASFYASASWNGSETNPQCWLATSHVGLRFDMEAQQYEFGDPLPPFTNSAQLYYPTILADTVNWILVSGSFVADSAYGYVSIGNHFDNAYTDTLHFADYAQYPRAHTLIDNVCVSLDPAVCDLAAGVRADVANSVLLYPNPVSDVLHITGVATGINASIHDACGRLLWQGKGTSGELIWDGRDHAPGMYVLRVNDAGIQRMFKFMLIE